MPELRAEIEASDIPTNDRTTRSKSVRRRRVELKMLGEIALMLQTFGGSVRVGVKEWAVSQEYGA
jgi:hypothetical protein